ncbi:hypothetical protein [Burkholderia ubonensis]|uniref:hypothetical protein n=1 Tax=Burkholderia ubonensis TaxID=101571 RepID=UPI0012F85903|nr:hypothetical protein [Burkholderia ubonensis]
MLEPLNSCHRVKFETCKRDSADATTKFVKRQAAGRGSQAVSAGLVASKRESGTIMYNDVARAIFSLMVSQHESLKLTARLVSVVAKNASAEDQETLFSTLDQALNSFDDVLEKTRLLIDKAEKNG